MIKGHKLIHPKPQASTDRSYSFLCHIRSYFRVEGNLNINSQSGCHRQCPHYIKDKLDGVPGKFHDHSPAKATTKSHALPSEPLPAAAAPCACTPRSDSRTYSASAFALPTSAPFSRLL